MSAAALPSLANASINLIAIREHAKKELAKIIKDMKSTDGKIVTGEKALVLDKNISGPLGLVAEVELLKKSGITKIHHLLPGPLYTDVPNIIYLVRPHISLMHIIADQMEQHRREDGAAGRRNYQVIFVPRRTMLCERVLADRGVEGDLVTTEYQLELIPFDDDVLSLEIDEGFKECFLDGNPTVLFYVARSLMKLQYLFGLIPDIKCKGSMATKVYQLMTRMRKEVQSSSFAALPEIESLIIIDRQVDMITPLLTQMTYEGLIDEMFCIKNSMIDVDGEVIGAKEPGKKKFILNSNDDLFKEIRDLNFRVLGPLLHKKAEYVKETYEGRTKAKTVGEMHEFMKNFKEAHQEHTYLQSHINLAEKISKVTRTKVWDQALEIERNLLQGANLPQCENYIDAMIYKMDPLPKVLRLVCLMSLTNGLKQKRWEQLKRDIVQTYGVESLFTLNNLEKLGMFTKQQKKIIWPNVRKALNLFQTELDLSAPKDFSYTYSGYAPLSVRLIELAHTPGWKRIEELMSQLPGRTLEAMQELPGGMQERFDYQHQPADAKGKGKEEKEGKEGKEAKEGKGDGKSGVVGGKKPLTLVYFVGGVTFAEISAIRHLSEKESHGRDYVVASTKLISGNSLIESIQEQLVNNLQRKSDRPEKKSDKR